MILNLRLYNNKNYESKLKILKHQRLKGLALKKPNSLSVFYLLVSKDVANLLLVDHRCKQIDLNYIRFVILLVVEILY